MSSTWVALKPHLHRALEAQGFRQVPLNELTAAPFHLPNGGRAVDEALTVVGTDPLWIEIVRQLVQLRTRAFVGLHLRRDAHDLEIVAIYAWTGTVARPLVVEHLEWVWQATNTIKRCLPEFQLTPHQSEAIEAVMGTLNINPVQKSLLQLVVDMNRATMPNTTLLAVDADGLSPGVVGDFKTLAPSRVSPNPLSAFNRPVVFSAVVDGTTGAVFGYNDWFSLNLSELEKALTFLARNG